MSKFSTKYGHFTGDGKEYVITNPRTPRPWINVISNGTYGLTISQSGSGFSWQTHSEFNRITRWHQDLIKDNWGKYLFIRDNKTGELWNPTWKPLKTELDKYECRHGLGYTTFISEYKNVIVKLTFFVPLNDNLEIWNIEIINSNNNEIDISLITYFEWVLGSSNDFHREFHKQFLETEYDPELNTLFAKKRIWDIPLGDRGHWNIDYNYTGFFSCSEKVESFEGDKENFTGIYNNLTEAQALFSESLSNTCGKFYDSIASLKIDLTIKPNKNKHVAFYLGLVESKKNLKSILGKYGNSTAITDALEKVKNYWTDLLAPMHIETPDEAMNFGVNYWFRYQAISGRLWGRTAFYQQSGAIGFRDQLQDSLVFLPIKPELTKKQILLHAGHQMKDGTVLHWWHPITDQGLKTEMTDDLLWLVFVVLEYIKETADYAILEETVPFYDDNNYNATILEHCLKAIDKVASRKSERGLLLIGAGDWNDGLSAVGLEMKGESVWLTEFFYYIVQSFIPVLQISGHDDLIEKYEKEIDNLKTAFEKHAWDGNWFWRASKDSGELIGSATSQEGKIFLNPQTWSVISGIIPGEKIIQAMDAVEQYLLKKNGPLLLYPAYKKPDKFIGYISRYAPGRRENGGVYSHAATWAIWAFSLIDRTDLALEVYSRLNPVLSGMEPDKYVAEPYVMPGNIDGPDSPFYGMAGWTWYTGSASWFQKVIVDWILGIRATHDGLLIDPKVPAGWKYFKVKRLFRGTVYEIEFVNTEGTGTGIKEIYVDGTLTRSNLIRKSVQNISKVKVVLGEPSYSTEIK